MSTEEQLKEIGKLTMRRTEARRQAALLHTRITETGNALSAVGRLLVPEYPNLGDLQKAKATLAEIVAAGGLDRINQDIAEYIEAAATVASISRTLKEASVE